MQLHFSPSMRSITISSTNNGFIDLMKIKVAARHISYRTLFHTILILAFLLPFVFILTALVTLEGSVNKCSSFGTLLSLFSNYHSLLFCFILFCLFQARSWFLVFESNLICSSCIVWLVFIFGIDWCFVFDDDEC
jgi:hypothetical protein